MCCVLREEDDHLIGGPSPSRKHGRTTAEDSVWEVASFDTGRAILFSEDATSDRYLDRSFKVDVTRFIQERVRPIHLQRGRCLDKSAEANE